MTTQSHHTDLPSGGYIITNVGTTLHAIKGTSSTKEDDVMLAVVGEKWAVKRVGNTGNVYTIVRANEYAFTADPPKESNVVLLRKSEYKWHICVNSEKPSQSHSGTFIYYCRIYTFSEENKELYWLGKKWEGKMAGEVDLSPDTTDYTEWIFDPNAA